MAMEAICNTRNMIMVHQWSSHQTSYWYQNNRVAIQLSFHPVHNIANLTKISIVWTWSYIYHHTWWPHSEVIVSQDLSSGHYYNYWNEYKYISFANITDSLGFDLYDQRLHWKLGIKFCSTQLVCSFECCWKMLACFANGIKTLYIVIVTVTCHHFQLSIATDSETGCGRGEVHSFWRRGVPAAKGVSNGKYDGLTIV